MLFGVAIDRYYSSILLLLAATMFPVAGQRLSYLLLLIPATASLAFLSPNSSFVPSPFVVAAAPEAPSSQASSNTALCSSSTGETANMAPPIPRWYQREISITAPSRGCHLITSQVGTWLLF